MKQMGACACVFKREEKSEWETGIALLRQHGDYEVWLIADIDGKIVTEIWNYRLQPYHGSFTTYTEK